MKQGQKREKRGFGAKIADFCRRFTQPAASGCRLPDREISVRMAFVKGSTKLSEIKIICVPSFKHKTVDLCIAANMHIPFAQIELYDSGLYKDAEATFDDAAALGEAIAHAWNAARDKMFESSGSERIDE